MKYPSKSEMWGPTGPMQEDHVNKLVRDKSGMMGIRTVLEPQDLELLYICLCEVWRLNPLYSFGLSFVKEKLEGVFELSWQIYGRKPKIFALRNGMVVRELVAPTQDNVYSSLYIVLENIPDSNLLDNDCVVLLPTQDEKKLPTGGVSTGEDYDVVEVKGDYDL
jgi:hypothetical protein